jgi:Uncharacterized protein conserved in bacteria
MSTFPTASIFADEPILSDVAQYWAEKRRGRLMPDRSDIDPLHLPPRVWPNLLLSEPVPDSSAIYYRLVGSAHVERYTFDFTGKTTAEIMQGSYRQYMESLYGAVLGRGLPVYSESRFRWDTGGFAAGHAFTRRLMLPLSLGDETKAAQVLSVQVWPTRLPVSPRPIPELGSNEEFYGNLILLDRDSFQSVEEPEVTR